MFSTEFHDITQLSTRNDRNRLRHLNWAASLKNWKKRTSKASAMLHLRTHFKLVLFNDRQIHSSVIHSNSIYWIFDFWNSNGCESERGIYSTSSLAVLGNRWWLMNDDGFEPFHLQKLEMSKFEFPEHAWLKPVFAQCFSLHSCIFVIST